MSVKEVAPGITAVATYWSHARAHAHVGSPQAGKTLYVQSDVTNHPPALFARNPGWHALRPGPEQMAEATRRKVYDMLVADKMMVRASTIRSRRWPMSKRPAGYGKFRE